MKLNKFILLTPLIVIALVIIPLLACLYSIKSESKPKEITYDSMFYDQWYLQNCPETIFIEDTTDEDGFSTEEISLSSTIDLGVNDFWGNFSTSKNIITIALIDSQVDINHQDLSNNIWANKNEISDNGIDDDDNGYVDDYYGWNFVNNSNEISSSSSNADHGTHCAGIIAANHNEIGVMGILGNTNVKLMILSIFESTDTELNYNNVISAIEYAEEMGADICNISSVCLEGENYFNKVITSSDMYFVVTAGNYQNQFFNGLDLNKFPRYPACTASDNVITVGSVDSEGQRSEFSNYSTNYLDVSAPGEYIYSTLSGNNYGYESGTSMATPIVTGIIGAYCYYYDVSVEEAVNLMLSNTDNSIAKFTLTAKN